MEKHRFKVQGMTCNNCAKRVSAALMAVEGVSSAQVDLQGSVVEVETTFGVDAAQLAAVLMAKGYPTTVAG